MLKIEKFAFLRHPPKSHRRRSRVMWWRSRARVFLLGPLIRRPSPLGSNLVFSKTPPAIPPSAPEWARQLQKLRLFSSANEAVSGDDEEKNPGFGSLESNDPLASVDAGHTAINGGSWKFQECEASPDTINFGEKGSLEDEGDANKVGEESLSSLWEKGINEDDASGIFVAEESSSEVAREEGAVPEIDMEQVEKIRSLLRGTLEESLETSLNQIDVILNEELVALVLQTPCVSVQNLIGFFKWALKNEEWLRSSRLVELLVNVVSDSAEITKMEAYQLWDLIKEIGNEKWLLNNSILNQLIFMFGRLVKPRAGLEVFNKFEDFGCSPDGNTYYLTIDALGKRSMFDTAWSVCEKMLGSGNLPDGEKVGKVIALLCKGKKAKEAHSVYLMAHGKEIFVPRNSLDFFISSLSRKDETLQISLQLLENYPKDSLKYANSTFASVVHGLCRTKSLQEAKKLLLRMVQLGPAPGNAVFNYVITAFSKEGELEDAISLMKVMEGRGLQPDIYTYTVIMSGYAKGGLMNEAYEIYQEAKKKHSKLSPVTYHILIRGYCKMEEYEKALNCLKEMKEDGVQPNSDEYNKLIQSLCLKALDWRTAEKLLEEMTESGLFLKRITRSLIAAVKELEEETKSESVGIEE